MWFRIPGFASPPSGGALHKSTSRTCWVPIRLNSATIIPHYDIRNFPTVPSTCSDSFVVTEGRICVCFKATVRHGYNKPPRILTNIWPPFLQHDFNFMKDVVSLKCSDDLQISLCDVNMKHSCTLIREKIIRQPNAQDEYRVDEVVQNGKSDRCNYRMELVGSESNYMGLKARKTVENRFIIFHIGALSTFEERKALKFWANFSLAPSVSTQNCWVF